MGNCFALYTAIRKSWARSDASRHAKALRVVKIDGKVLEHRRPVIPVGSSPSSVSSERVNGSKRIKVIMTKQQLEELLVIKKISVEEMLWRSLHEEEAWDGIDNSLTRWRPMLETIPEGSDHQ